MTCPLRRYLAEKAIVNRLLGTTLTILVFPVFPAEAKTVGFSLPWTWLWSRSQERSSTTIIHPAPQAIIRRDHSVAEAQARSAWQREKAVFERQHREKLQTYIDTRLALAEESARLSFIRSEQLARATTESRSDLFSHVSGTASGLAATAVSAAGVWVANPGSSTNVSQQPPITPERLFQRAKHVAREIPKRTEQVISGNDELVVSTMAHGMPKGLAVFMALLMLHVPSVAVASLVTGVFFVRGHRPRSGVFFLGLAAVLGVIIFFVLPW